MLFAIQGLLAALEIDTGVLLEGNMWATPAVDVHHAVLSMLRPVNCCIAPFDTEGRFIPAAFM